MRVPGRRAAAAFPLTFALAHAPAPAAPPKDKKPLPKDEPLVQDPGGRGGVRAE